MTVIETEAAPTPTPTAVRYPTATRMLRVPVEGQKRRRLLVVLAMLEDEGVKATVPLLVERAKLKDHRQLASLVQRLEADGYLRQRKPKKNRSRFELLV